MSSFITINILILIIIFVALFSWSLYGGKKVIARFILAFYPTTLIFQNFPYLKIDSAILQIIAYALIFAVIYFFMKKNLTARNTYSGGRKIFDGIILSLSGTILVLITYYYLLPISDLYTLNLSFSNIFTETLPLGLWYIIPLTGIVLTNKSDD